MYSLPHFKEKDPKLVMEFIHAHPFAFMSGCDENNHPVATQIPVFIEERDGKIFLSGHMMKQTDHHKAFEKNPHVLCVFTGHHTYVSATWYSNPHQASTWNYMSVHVKGIIRFLGHDELVEVLRKTSLHFEKGDVNSTTAYDNLPAEYVGKLMNAIVAFEVEVQSMENVFKLSQNRDEESFQSIIHHLGQGDADAKTIACEMAKRKKELYP